MLPVPSSGGAVAVAGALAGGAVVAAGFKASHAVERMAAQCVNKEEKHQLTVLSALVHKHLNDYLANPEELLASLRFSCDELSVLAPVFPQAQLAYDAIRQHQKLSSKSSELSWTASFAAYFASDKSPDGEAKICVSTLACEIVKSWLRTTCENEHVSAEEVEAYRNFCCGFLNHHDEFPGSGRHCFVHAMSLASQHLDSMWQYILHQRRHAAGYIQNLRVESYHFTLHAVQVILLAATECEIPKQVYSIDSLQFLHDSSLPPALLNYFDSQIATDMARFWATDSGRLLCMILRSQHGSNMCAWLNAAHEEVKTIQVKVIRAGNLPTSLRFADRLEPYVTATVMQRKHGMTQAVSFAKTTQVSNTGVAAWEEVLELQLPMGEDVHVHIDVRDHVDLSINSSVKFASAHALSIERVVEYLASGEEVRLPLKLVSGATARQGSLHGAYIVVRFESPCFHKEIGKLRAQWQNGKFENSGLINNDLYEPFLESVESLDSLMYFMDILFSECLELTNLLGDLGLVMCAKFVRPLLDEVEHRTMEVSDFIFKGVWDRNYNKKLEELQMKTGRMCYVPFQSKGSYGMKSLKTRDKLAEAGAQKMRLLKQRVLSSLVLVRRAAANATAASIVQKAKGKMERLSLRLSDPQTTKRSSKFANAVQDVPGKTITQDPYLSDDSCIHTPELLVEHSKPEPPALLPRAAAKFEDSRSRAMTTQADTESESSLTERVVRHPRAKTVTTQADTESGSSLTERVVRHPRARTVTTFMQNPELGPSTPGTSQKELRDWWPEPLKTPDLEDLADKHEVVEATQLVESPQEAPGAFEYISKTIFGAVDSEADSTDFRLSAYTPESTLAFPEMPKTQRGISSAFRAARPATMGFDEEVMLAIFVGGGSSAPTGRSLEHDAEQDSSRDFRANMIAGAESIPRDDSSTQDDILTIENSPSAQSTDEPCAREETTQGSTANVFSTSFAPAMSNILERSSASLIISEPSASVEQRSRPLVGIATVCDPEGSEEPPRENSRRPWGMTRALVKMGLKPASDSTFATRASSQCSWSAPRVISRLTRARGADAEAEDREQTNAPVLLGRVGMAKAWQRKEDKSDGSCY